MSGHDGLRAALQALLAHHDRQNGVHEGSPNDCAEGRAARAALRAADHPEPLTAWKAGFLAYKADESGNWNATEADIDRWATEFAAYQERSRPENET
jgi:hypothetical protein